MPSDHDSPDERIAELLDAITNTRPGTATTWTSRGIDVTVYGQRRHELHTPTPWANITIAGRTRPIHTWHQLLDHVDALADERASPVPQTADVSGADDSDVGRRG